MCECVGLTSFLKKPSRHTPTRENRTVARCRHGLLRPAPPEIGGADTLFAPALRRRQRYRLIAWIVQGWKSVTARWALAHNEELKLGIPDPKHLWMRDYWDRYIRNDRHFDNTVLYIHQNPVNAGLCQRAEDWP